MRIWAILVAAGSGRRFGAPKHSVTLDGFELWQLGRKSLLEGGVDEVVAVGDMAGGIPGGPRRRDSVAAGLAEVPFDVDFVLVHDAARPLASPALVRRVIDRLRLEDVDAVVPVVPVPDTLKLTLGENVVRTVDRAHLVRAQTPQGFRGEVLRRAHEVDTADATDDASMVEGLGGSVATVPGERENLKVTYPEDLDLVRSLYSARDG